MVIRIINDVLRPIGLEVRKTFGGRSGGFALYSYKKRDGSFDYEKYRRIQTEGNKRKIHKVYAREENIASISGYIRESVPEPKFGICHGTRRGREQEWFRKYLGCEVIGTEISDTAEQFPHTIQWDFHEAKPEWIDSADFIYSNSFDHSYNPEACLNTWMSCVKPGGLCILEHGRLHDADYASKLDPFGADIVQMPFLITIWGQGRYGVRQIVQLPVRGKGSEDHSFIAIQRF